MDESPVKIVELRDLTQLEECAEIQQKIWGISTQDVIPTHLMKAYTDPEEPWGILLGAYADNEMAGFALTLPTSRMDTCLLHMAGVVPEAQNRNIGHKLLQETKIIAAKRGAKKIVLTYDPLESINANLYIRKHSGICRKYVADYYRMYHSKTHSGFPADRFKVEIFLDQKDREKVIPVRSGKRN